jgi:Cu-processing system permease protein
MPGLLIVAALTLVEARRRRIVAAAGLCAGAFLAVFGTAVWLSADELRGGDRPFLVVQAAIITMCVAGVFAANFLSVLFAVLLPVDTLSGEIESGVMQTLASKPVRRADIVLGKWLGHAVIVLVYMNALVLGTVGIVRLASGFLPANLPTSLALMSLEVILLLTVSIAGGTRLSTVTNGILALGFYGIGFIGGWVEQVGTMVGIASAKAVGIAASLVSPADAMWRLAAYDLQPEVVRDLVQTPFTTGAIPSARMVWWAVGFAAAGLVWAVRSFERRTL